METCNFSNRNNETNIVSLLAFLIASVFCLCTPMPAHAQQLTAKTATARQGNQTSAIVTTAENAATPFIQVQPTAQTVTAGQSVSFSVMTVGASSYQWQVCINGEWTTVADNTIYSDANTRTLTIHNVPYCYNGYTYVCHAINHAGVTVSKAVCLTVKSSCSVLPLVAKNVNSK